MRTDGYTYDAFGAPTHTTGTSPNTFQFTGQQTDSDSGLQYLRARYYDPSTGRFLSQDPIAGGNPYAYASNNPVNRIDPSGMCDLGFFDPPVPCSPPLPPIPPTPTEIIDAIKGVTDCALDGLDCPGEIARCVSDLIACTYSARAPFTIWLEQKVRDRVGGTSHDKEGGITVITGCSDICDLLGPDFTIGHTIFTRNLDIAQITLAHEKRHVRQYEILGDLFWYIYGANDTLCIGSNHFDACVHAFNILEILAGPS